ncbi:MaoC family dehydratase [Amycolatopsis acidicola]|uniref:MaoC family dehydratase n=1 Tax=Amycolatopsis acidicola TaxID=2596893 RepID=A0A5N0USH2_9PSEU|nr:MaoC family dehydratase [Amycolatopsis acidicola]KAA9153961.1 MaoC family dehydratase [Amycolatopsis acidicola]
MTAQAYVPPGAGKKEARYELVTIPEPFGPVEFTVDEDKVRSYAFAQGDYGSWYFGDSPFGGRVGHALVLANDLLFLFYDGYDGNTAQGLHTHEHLRFHSPVKVGEKVRVTGGYTEKYERRGQGYVVLEAEARAEDGRLLVTHVGREIMRTVAGEVVGRSSSGGGDGRRVRAEARADLPVAEHAVPGLAEGTPVRGLRRAFTQDQMDVFSWAGHGYANVHTSMEKAAKSGLDSTIVQAQQQTGLIVEAMVAFFGASWFTSGDLDMRFVNPTFVGEALTVHGAVLGEQEGRLELEVWTTKDDGTRTALGWASAALEDVTPGPIPLLG